MNISKQISNEPITGFKRLTIRIGRLSSKISTSETLNEITKWD